MKGIWVKYTDAELLWLEANRTMPIADYHLAFCAHFDRSDVTAGNLHSLRKRKRWRTGRTGRFDKGAVPLNKGKKCAPGTSGLHPNARKTQFKKGGLPANTKHAGHERISTQGYVEISIDQVNPHTGFARRYVQKHRWLWKKLHGPVPAGMVLKCKGDKANPDPSNWDLIPRALLPRLNGRFGRDYDRAPAELKATIMAVAKLAHEVLEKAK